MIFMESNLILFCGERISILKDIDFPRFENFLGIYFKRTVQILSNSYRKVVIACMPNGT